MRDLVGLILGSRNGAQDTGGWRSQAKREVQRVWVQDQEMEEEDGEPWGDESEAPPPCRAWGRRKEQQRDGERMQEGIGTVGFGV